MTTIVNPADTLTGYAVRLAGTLPRTDTTNGLTAIARDLADNPRDIRFAVIAFDVAKTIANVDDGSETAVIRILRIEPATGRTSTAVSKLLLDAVKTRTGQQLSLDDLTDPDDSD